VDVIVEKIEFDPFLLASGAGPAVPPPPTVIGYVCTVTGKAPALQLGLGNVVLKPPAPPPPPPRPTGELCPLPAPPATTT
jgi:hypothetical protein